MRFRAALMMAALAVAGCKGSAPSTQNNQQDNMVVPAAPSPVGTMKLLADGSPLVCTAEDVKQTLLSMARPDTAETKALANSGTYPFHSSDVDALAAAVDLDLSLETLASVDKAVQSVKCDGNITVAAPAYRLSSPEPLQVEYEVRPSVEDPANFVIRANIGPAKEAAQDLFNNIIQQVQSHAASAAAVAALNSPPPATSAPSNPNGAHPSFDCSRVMSYVLNAICGDSDLIAKDNQLTSIYQTKLAKADGSGDDAARTALINSERAWIASRQACGDKDCISAAYDDRITELRNSD